MASKPRLYARTRVKTIDSRLVSSPKPNVLVLINNEADANIIIDTLNNPILCQVIRLSDIKSLNHYYKSCDDSSQTIYLAISDSFAQEMSECGNVHTVPTSLYILFDSYEISHNWNEDARYFHDAVELGKALRNFLDLFLTLEDVDLSSQSVSIETTRFVWFQFMFTLLSSLERTDISMKEVLNKLHTNDIITKSKLFQEFVETYTTDKAIEWCMKDSFYFTYVNQILRSKNVNDIFTHRAIIHDIEQSLILLHHEQDYIWDAFLPMYVYRGQKTSRQELQSWQSNIGSIITMNSFISTSMDEKIAYVFTETFDNEDDDDEATLFKIRLDKTTAPKTIYVYLYHGDYDDVDDCEILFSLRTLFRIDRVKYSKLKETWYIDMTVIDQDNHDVQKKLIPWKTSIFHDKNILQSKNDELIYVRDLSVDNGIFLTFQLSLDIILRLERNDYAKQEMLSICRKIYHNDRFTLTKINQFQLTYQSEKDAIRWYTADSFLYRLLNEILRSETINSIFNFRYFIQDLHNTLALMQIDYFKKLQQTNCPVLKLYRGQIMSKNDLYSKFYVNKGNLISINSFLSTTTDRYVARIFSGDGSIENSDIYVSVLYEITVDTRLPHSIPFAELVNESNFEDENEVLFSIGAVFRIDDIHEDNRYLRTVKLTLTTEEDEQWNMLTEHLQKDEEFSTEINNQTLIIDDEKRIATVEKSRKRSRSFDAYCFPKRDLRRYRLSDSYRRNLIRHIEQPLFSSLYKEI